MQSDSSKVHARLELPFREKILGCFSKPVSCPKFVCSPFYLSCGQVPTLSLEKSTFSAADKTTVIPCGANGENSEENLTGPIRLRPQNGNSSLKGEHPEAIL